MPHAACCPRTRCRSACSTRSPSIRMPRPSARRRCRTDPLRSSKMRLAFSVLLCCVCSLVQAGLNIQHWVAPSGARVYFVENHDLPMLDVQVDLGAGTAFDDPARPGVAALTHGLLDAGAGKLDEH